jgi:hypothetical protein
LIIDFNIANKTKTKVTSTAVPPLLLLLSASVVVNNIVVVVVVVVVVAASTVKLLVSFDTLHVSISNDDDHETKTTNKQTNKINKTTK